MGSAFHTGSRSLSIAVVGSRRPMTARLSKKESRGSPEVGWSALSVATRDPCAPRRKEPRSSRLITT